MQCVEELAVNIEPMITNEEIAMQNTIEGATMAPRPILLKKSNEEDTNAQIEKFKEGKRKKVSVLCF